MALPSSGTISISQIAAEFGGSAPHSLSEYYRNGGLVTSNNTSVPTSGTISMSNFYGAVNEIGITQGSATNINLSTVFGGNWSSSVPKRLTINSGTTIGGSGAVAMTIPSGMGGTLTIDNAGLIVGFGGAANSGAGGTAISNATSGVTINNTGTIAGGGGGGGGGGSGGTGGQGGSGSFTSTTTQTFSNCNAQWILLYDPYGFNSCTPSSINGKHNIYAPSWGINITGYYSFPYSYGGWTYTKGSSSAANCGTTEVGESCFATLWVPIRSQTTTTSTTGGAGGSGGGGGAGGSGGGYNQTAASGSAGSAGAAGSAGGTSAGTGGQGGTGGTGGSGGGYGSGGGSGNTGATGATGAAGNAGSGSGGSAGSGGSGGGAAGAAVSGTSVTMNNSGSIFGAVA